MTDQLSRKKVRICEGWAKSEGEPQGESEVRRPKSEVADHHQRPQEQDLRTLAQDSRTGDAAERAPIAVAPAVTALQAQNSGGDGAENTHKNTGASGYVEENTGNLKTDSAAVPSASVCQPMPEAAPPHDNVTESKAV
ncbi:MAG: hypothetical protein ABSH52_34495, partial [Terriglobia bacterium]